LKKKISASTDIGNGSTSNPGSITSADTDLRTDTNDGDLPTSDAHLLVQIHVDETAADVETDDDDDENDLSPDSAALSVVSENSPDIPSTSTGN